MAASEFIPIALKAPTTEGLMRKIAEFQAMQGGKASIVTIYKDGKDHVCWIYPIKGMMSVVGL